MKNTCIPGNTKVLVPIEEIVTHEKGFIFKIGKVTIQTSETHPFLIQRNDEKKCLPANEIQAGDMLETSVSLLNNGTKVLGADGLSHSVNLCGPMICMTINRIRISTQKHSMKYYIIEMKENAEMAATELHSFSVVRDGKVLYLPTHMLKKDDMIWIDQSAFMADGTLYFKKNKKAVKK